MADIRIKDITTTASASLTGDFLPIDGSTGTRKLSAFSPTFGGNATVTGTLSSAGNLSVTGTSAQIILGQSSGSQLTYLIRPAQAGGAIQMVQDSATINRWLSLGRADNSGVYVESMRLNDAGVVSISATTASTTTSTGALVVGNGTSGGLGVGGAAFIGGALSMYGEDFTIHNVGYGSWTLRNTAGSAVFDIRNGAGSWLTFPGAATGTVEFKTLATTVKVAATTASTSTSSGALVVSGGVGVGEQIHAKYYTATSNIVAGFTANTHILDYYSGTARNVVFGPDASTIGNWKLQLLRSDASASIDALTVSNAGNGVFYGSVKTAAPSGGTSAAWKLGTVATVSPTSPNRTIEVDIGGTIYYIAAKTTNN